MPILKFPVSRDDAMYQAWPDVVLTESGKLICVFSECTHHGNRDYTRLMLVTSRDRGRTWTPKVPLSEATHGLPYWNCARISHLSDGRLAIVGDKINSTGESNAINYLWFADGEGLHWEGPFPTPMTGIVPDKLLELPGGRWILSSHDKSPVTGFLEQSLRYSDNQGKTWSAPVTVASQAGLNLCEGSILPLPDGTLVCFMRENSGLGYDCFKAFSTDNGDNWTGPYHLPLPGCHRPVSGFLQSGRIMITHRFMQGGKGWVGNWTQNFFAALTDVDSAKATQRSEQWCRIMPVDFDRSPVSDLGYSGWVQFEDGEIYVVNYIVDDAPKGQIRGYSFFESDFILK